MNTQDIDDRCPIVYTTCVLLCTQCMSYCVHNMCPIVYTIEFDDFTDSVQR